MKYILCGNSPQSIYWFDNIIQLGNSLQRKANKKVTQSWFVNITCKLKLGCTFKFFAVSSLVCA